MPIFNQSLGVVKAATWYSGTADSDSAIKQQVTNPLNGDFYFSETSGNVWKYAEGGGGIWNNISNLKGPQGLKGEASVVKQVVTTSANFSTGDAPYIVTIEDADITSTSFIRVYPNDESTIAALANLTNKLVTSYIGKFEFSLTSNAVTALNLTYEIVEVL